VLVSHLVSAANSAEQYLSSTPTSRTQVI